MKFIFLRLKFKFQIFDYLSSKSVLIIDKSILDESDKSAFICDF